MARVATISNFPRRPTQKTMSTWRLRLSAQLCIKETKRGFLINSVNDQFLLIEDGNLSFAFPQNNQ